VRGQLIKAHVLALDRRCIVGDEAALSALVDLARHIEP
jgi:hypothetical protein